MNDNIFEVHTSWKAIIPDVLLIFLFIGMFTIWGKITKIKTTKLIITDKTISAKSGLVGSNTLDSPINKITSIKVEQNLLGKIFNYGTIHINTPAGFYTFECLDNPNQIKDLIFNKMN